MAAGVLIAVTAVAVGFSVVTVLGDRPKEYVASTDAERFIEEAMSRIDVERFAEVVLIADAEGEGIIVGGTLSDEEDFTDLEALLATIEPRVPVRWELADPW